MTYVGFEPGLLGVAVAVDTDHATGANGIDVPDNLKIQIVL